MNVQLKLKILEKYGTQTNFAVAQQVPEHYVSRAVRERLKPPLKTKLKWAKALGCKPSEIFPEVKP